MHRIRLTAVDRLHYLSDAVAGKTILHVGCCGIIGKLEDPGEKLNHLHYCLDQSATRAFGVDLDSAELARMRELGLANLYEGDASRLDEVDFGTRFELILFGNMFNYLSDIGDTLRRAGKLLQPGGEIVITVDNDYAIKRMLRYVFSAKDSSFRHHVFSVGPYTLPALLEAHGWQAGELKSFWLGPDIFLKQRWISRLSNVLLRLLPRSANLADGLILRVTPRD